jgi:hypothetical protein
MSYIEERFTLSSSFRDDAAASVAGDVAVVAEEVLDGVRQPDVARSRSTCARRRAAARIVFRCPIESERGTP